MAAIPVAQLVLGMGVAQGVGSFVSGMQQSSELKSQASIARQNAVIETEFARRNAAIITAEGKREAADTEREGRRAIARSQASFAASGAELSGSALDVLNDQFLEVMYQGSQITRSAEARASGEKFRGAEASRKSLLQAGQFDRDAGRAFVGGAFGLGTSILGGYTDYRRLSGALV